MNVICFGDSNTYGYDPRSWFGGRYEMPWVDILAKKTGWSIVNEGRNGQEIPAQAITVPGGTDLLTVMLGTNDLLQGRTAAQTAVRMEAFLTSLAIERHKLLLIAPPPMKLGEWVPDPDLIDASIQLTQALEALSRQLDIRFADARQWDIPLAFDGVHFTEDGHRIFAEHLYPIVLS